MTATLPRLVDAVAAGELLCVPASWCLAEARAERIPHVHVGRYVRFDPDELVAWWRARVEGPRAPRRPKATQSPPPKETE